MSTFDARLLSAETFVPHAYAELDVVGAFPPGAVPEKAYLQLAKKYREITDIDVRRIVYESDGLKVTGLMACPRNAAPGRHPVLVYNRGGNGEYGRLTLVNVMRALVPMAARGYVVFASNYRGNDGGEGREEFGGADVRDVLNLLDIARAHPAFDGRNAYLLGHSRGGMMTYLALKHGASVQAAAAIAALSDLEAIARERPGMEKIFAAAIPGDGETHIEALRERSAVYWPEKLRAPLLLIHGDADDRVDVSHSQRLSEKLRAANLEHALEIYPGGGHALIRQWEDVLQSIHQWFLLHRAQETPRGAVCA